MTSTTTAYDLHPGVSAFLGSGRGNGSAARRHQLLIGGEWVDALSGRTFVTADPATGEPLTEVAEGGAPDIDRAVVAARKAFEDGAWAKISPSDRAKLVWKLGDLLLEHAEEFAQLESLDVGKSALVAG